MGDRRAATTRWLAVTPASGVCSHPAFTPDGESVILAFENADNPPSLWQYAVKLGIFSPLICPDVNPSLRSGRAIRAIPTKPVEAGFPNVVGDFNPQCCLEHITYPSLDGLPVPALLYQSENPVDAAVIYIHGGPNWLSQNHWDEHINDFLQRGWVVLAPNYRGSIGYGRKWQLANRLDPGGGDCNDILAAADFLIQSNLSDPKRIALTGRSYGGYLTMMALVRAPEKWAAGSAVAPFLNFLTSFENAREDVHRWDIENFGDPQHCPEFFRERSPFFHLDRVQAPVQLICGAHDLRCPASESIAARDELQRLGKPVELCLYPDEGHVFLKSENILDARLKRLDFFERCL
jgi:dipeptidyl aminopeptidase/acylaminoacyl peptidase